MNLLDVYEMPLYKDTEYTKLTPHDDCVLATIVYISKTRRRGKWYIQTVGIMDETCWYENIYFRDEYEETMLKKDKDEGKQAVWRLRAKKDEYSESLCGYPKELLEEVIE